MTSTTRHAQKIHGGRFVTVHQNRPAVTLAEGGGSRGVRGTSREEEEEWVFLQRADGVFFRIPVEWTDPVGQRNYTVDPDGGIFTYKCRPNP